MKIAWITDIHFNFLEPEQILKFLEKLQSKNADVVLMSGDIGEANTLFDYLTMIHESISAPIYFVLGNHDYYKGTIKNVRSSLKHFSVTYTRLVWLNNAGVISLTKKTALVGHDSWADGRLGDFWASRVIMNDFLLIGEFIQLDQAQCLSYMQSLAEEAAKHFEKCLPLALETHEKVIILTHVPPFEGASWHQGKISDSWWLPYFSSKVVGDSIKSVMESYPDKQALVLCGHTHSSGIFQALPNLQVLTGKAEYGRPQIQDVLEVS